jgi:hypothetical protein
MLLVGAMGPLKAILLIASQVLAGIAAAAVVSGLFPGPLAVRTRLATNTSVVRGLFIEMFLTFELIFCIFMLAAEKHRATFLAPIGIGLALLIAELAGKCLLLYLLHDIKCRRCFLHWWITQSCALLWSRCRSRHFRWLPLDLLDWPTARRPSRCPVLPLHQSTRV